MKQSPLTVGNTVTNRTNKNDIKILVWSWNLHRSLALNKALRVFMLLLLNKGLERDDHYGQVPAW